MDPAAPQGPHAAPCPLSYVLRRQIAAVLASLSHLGVPIAEFEESFAARYGLQVDARLLGYRDTLEMLRAIPGVVEVVEREVGDGGVMWGMGGGRWGTWRGSGWSGGGAAGKEAVSE